MFELPLPIAYGVLKRASMSKWDYWNIWRETAQISKGKTHETGDEPLGYSSWTKRESELPANSGEKSDNYREGSLKPADPRSIHLQWF